MKKDFNRDHLTQIQSKALDRAIDLANQQFENHGIMDPYTVIYNKKETKKSIKYQANFLQVVPAQWNNPQYKDSFVKSAKENFIKPNTAFVITQTQIRHYAPGEKSPERTTHQALILEEAGYFYTHMWKINWIPLGSGNFKLEFTGDFKLSIIDASVTEQHMSFLN
jgi:hypothetical protein